jgi:hypothetical protein
LLLFFKQKTSKIDIFREKTSTQFQQNFAKLENVFSQKVRSLSVDAITGQKREIPKKTEQL